MKKTYHNNKNGKACWTRPLVTLLSAGVLLAGGLPGAAEAAKSQKLTAGNEYLLVTNYPNNLHVLDLKTETLLKTCQLPDAFGPGTVVTSPDNSTAYILNNHYEDIYGVNLDSCELVFTARQSSGNERVKSIFSLAVSSDGKELYTVQNPTLLNKDHYRVQQPRLAVYKTNAGLDAKPIRTLPAPRQISVMSVLDDGTLLMAGEDFYSFDVNSGKKEVVLTNRNWQRPLYAPPDVLNVWPMDTPSHEFLSLYTTARFQDKSMNMDTADWIYGFHTIDLKTGKAESLDFGPITEIYFTGMRNPTDKNQVFGVLNRLAKYDLNKKELIKAAELDHSYYCIAMNHSGSKVYLTGTYNEVAIFDSETLEQTNSIQLPGGDMAITTAQVIRR